MSIDNVVNEETLDNEVPEYQGASLDGVKIYSLEKEIEALNKRISEEYKRVNDVKAIMHELWNALELVDLNNGNKSLNDLIFCGVKYKIKDYVARDSYTPNMPTYINNL